MEKIAVYPGTFDPVTYGHIDLINRAARIFDKVIVAVAHNKSKGALFSVAERVTMLKGAVMDDPVLHERLKGVGILSKADAIDYAALGPQPGHPA